MFFVIIFRADFLQTEDQVESIHAKERDPNSIGAELYRRARKVRADRRNQASEDESKEETATRAAKIIPILWETIWLPTLMAEAEVGETKAFVRIATVEGLGDLTEYDRQVIVQCQPFLKAKGLLYSISPTQSSRLTENGMEHRRDWILKIWSH